MLEKPDARKQWAVSVYGVRNSLRSDRIGRRTFIAGFGVAAVWTFGAPKFVRSAEPPPRIGVIIPGSPPRDTLEAFRAGLRDLGYIEGQNLVLEVRYDHNDTTRYEGIAAEFARLPLRAVFVPRELHFVRAMKAIGAKDTVPIVAVLVTPVEIGEVHEIGRHGTNVTGTLLVPLEIYAKRLQLLKEAAPGITRVLALHQTPEGYARRTEVFVERLTTAAGSLGLEILLRAVDTPEDFERVVEGAVRDGADSLITAQDAFFLMHRQRLAAIAAAHGLPSISGETGYAVAGGLMDYGPSIPRVFRDSAIFIDKILKGAKAAELPIRQPSRFDLTVNLKTAKALGIEMPRSILLRATEVIE